MVGQYCSCEEENWKMAGMRGLHRSEQGLPKRSFPHASNRPAGGCHCRSPSDELFGHLSMLPPNTFSLGRSKKTVFVTPIGNYHYKVMRFRLKNAGSTYQRMMTRMFEPQLGKNIEVYIDDMVVKSKLESEHVNDLRNIFAILRRHKLRLNASKCSFGVGLGKFLGYVVTHYKIEVNPD